MLREGPGRRSYRCFANACADCTGALPVGGPCECDCHGRPAQVSLPLPLAQRILAALERDIWTELAAELRAVIGK